MRNTQTEPRPPGSGFWLLTCLLLIALAAIQLLSVTQENQTYDEGIQLSAGFRYFKTGDFRMDIEQPPLAKYIAASPLLFLHLRTPVEQKPADFAQQFLYHNRLPADTILFVARTTTILVTLCLGLTIALWTRKEFGAKSALLALLLFTLDPTVIAHGRYATNDMVLTLFTFLAGLAWISFLRRRTTRALLASGVLLGLALASKFSAVFLLPAFVLMYLAYGWRDRTLFSERVVLKSFGVLAATAFLIVAVAYAPQAKKLIPVTEDQRAADPSIEMLADINSSTFVGRVLAWTGGALGLQQHPFLVGLNEQARHNASGHPAYLLGKTSNFGRWNYFPVAFAVKTPVATLAALLLALVLSIRFRRTLDVRHLMLAIPVLVYLAFSLSSNVNIGIRHLLPIYPFLFVLMASILARYDWPRLSLIAVVLLAESLSIYPHHLAFFNVLAGGPGNGPRYLVDSNLDWGQDLKNLKRYMEANNIPRVCLGYFGSADPAYYGIAADFLPVTSQTEQRASVNCVAAVSATLLYGAYLPEDYYSWLRERMPMAKIGYSIYVYDLRK